MYSGRLCPKGRLRARSESRVASACLSTAMIRLKVKWDVFMEPRESVRENSTSDVS
jgi:hypothetical protein